MVKTLNQFLSNGEIELLISVYVLETVPNNDWIAEQVIDKLKKKMMYDMRAISHRMSISKVFINEQELKASVWKYFLRREIDKGKTTGQIAEEIEKPLGLVNSFI